MMPALRSLYDDIWVYGLPQFLRSDGGHRDFRISCDGKIVYTGYLQNWVPDAGSPTALQKIDGPYFLVTAGGGGDGEDLIDWVILAYET